MLVFQVPVCMCVYVCGKQRDTISLLPRLPSELTGTFSLTEVHNVQSHPDSCTFHEERQTIEETDLSGALDGKGATGCTYPPRHARGVTREDKTPQHPRTFCSLLEPYLAPEEPARRHSATANQFL